MTLNLNYKNWDYTIILLLFIFLVAALSSCDPVVTSSDISEDTQAIGYIRDPRTNLCFASLTSRFDLSYSVTSITCVPCDSVKHLLK